MEITQLNALNAMLVANAPSIDLNVLVPQSGGLSDDYIGTITGVGYVVMPSLILKRDQTIKIAGVETVNKAGSPAVSLSVTFADKTNVALSVLRRSRKSTLDGATFAALDYTELAKLVGKKIKVVSSLADKSTEKTTNWPDDNGVPQPKTTIGKAYVMVTVA